MSDISNMIFKKVTEEPSHYRHLEKMSIGEIITNINKEDHVIPAAVQKALPEIEALIEAVVEKMLHGGRLFYIGAGTSGRLGILDASECPPTYGVPAGLVVGVIAGGEEAMVKAVENAEDHAEQGWLDLEKYKVNSGDFVLGIATSGTTPYVIGALEKCNENGILTGSIACNPNSPVSQIAKFPIEVIVGPEFITGSTRMKSGTATKLVLNMISTAAMIRLGRVEDNKMVNMQLTNQKIIERGVRMLMERGDLTDQEAREMLSKYQNVKVALEHLKS